jgi:integrase
MASITRRGNAYRIAVLVSERVGGPKKFYKTWKPEAGMNKKQIEKELVLVAARFEEECFTQGSFEEGMSFNAFAKKWMEEHAERELKPTTIARYRTLLPRICAAIGKLKLLEITPRHIIELLANLAESGIREDGKYKCIVDLESVLMKKKMSRRALARLANISTSTLYQVEIGRNISKDTMKRVADALGLKEGSAFEKSGKSALSKQTQLHYFRLISSILSTAVYWQMIPDNPCRRVKAPKVDRRESRYLDDDEAKMLLACLEDEDIQFRTFIKTVLFTGLRRGEACGLKWGDFDLDEGIVHIERSLVYTPSTGIVLEKPKTKSSVRDISIPKSAVDMLKEYRKWQMKEIKKLGDRWFDNELVFPMWNGKPEDPNKVSNRFSNFIEKRGLPSISLHSLRHTNATLLISAGVDLKTVSARLGHAKLSTTFNVYTHSIMSANKKAADTMEEILS